MTVYLKNIYINNYYSMLGSKSKDPSIMNKVDYVFEHFDFKDKTCEESESIYQSISINGLLDKGKKEENDIDVLISGDLQNQLFASHFNARKFNIPFLGVYSACASFTEGLIIASSLINSELNNIIVTTSSHNLANEKQFRFPIEYGAVRKKTNSFSSTGSVSVLVNRNISKIRIESFTIGSVIDMGHKDSNDMGAAMAPAAGEVIYKHLKETNRSSSYYDIILTGDLGDKGLKILKEYMNYKYKNVINNIKDAGHILYKEEKDYVGGSGPICLPLILFNSIIYNKKYKKILIVGTGSLHSVVSCNLKESMPSIAHAISLEVL